MQSIPPHQFSTTIETIIQLNELAVAEMLRGRNQSATDIFTRALADANRLVFMGHVPMPRATTTVKAPHRCVDKESDMECKPDTSEGSEASSTEIKERGSIEIESPEAVTASHSVQGLTSYESRLHVRVGEHVVSIPNGLILALPLPSLEGREDDFAAAFFNRAFLILKREAPMDVILPSLYFNLALAFHRQGIQTGKTNSCWGNAIFLYEQALSILDDVPEAKSSAEITLLAALYQNMYQIHMEYFHADEAREIRKKLRAFLDWNGSLLLGQEDFAFFHVHLYLTVCEDFRLSPSA